jgi:hypothetical protein
MRNCLALIVALSFTKKRTTVCALAVNVDYTSLLMPLSVQVYGDTLLRLRMVGLFSQYVNDVKRIHQIIMMKRQNNIAVVSVGCYK